VAVYRQTAAPLSAGAPGYRSLPVLSILTPQTSEDAGELVGLRLRRREYAHEGGKSLLMNAPALRQREALVAV
jgi:hypothetical protein